MDIEKKRIWQIAAGDTDRNYADICIKWDVVLNGPGSCGPYPRCEDKLIENGWSAKKLSVLNRFCFDVKEHDLVVLRLGTKFVYAVGIVENKYLWYEDFGDIDGWDLQHVRRVKWLWKSPNKPKEFAAYSMKWGDTTQLLSESAGTVRNWLISLVEDENEKDRQLVELPRTCEDGKTHSNLELSTLRDFLVDRGKSSAFISSLISKMQELIEIANWYLRSREKISERETVSHIVVPLLKTLGWTAQKMAVEWDKIDIGLFNELPRDDSRLVCAIEAKQMSASCLTATRQVFKYATKDNRFNCTRAIVTDGIRYGIFIRDHQGDFPLRPSAYLNLTRLKENYPILECDGAKEAIYYMTPEWSMQNR